MCAFTMPDLAVHDRRNTHVVHSRDGFASDWVLRFSVGHFSGFSGDFRRNPRQCGASRGIRGPETARFGGGGRKKPGKSLMAISVVPSSDPREHLAKLNGGWLGGVVARPTRRLANAEQLCCALQRAGSSMCLVSAIVVRSSGWRPATIASTIGGARNRSCITRRTYRMSVRSRVAISATEWTRPGEQVVGPPKGAAQRLEQWAVDAACGLQAVEHQAHLNGRAFAGAAGPIG